MLADERDHVHCNARPVGKQLGHRIHAEAAALYGRVLEHRALRLVEAVDPRGQHRLDAGGQSGALGFDPHGHELLEEQRLPSALSRCGPRHGPEASGAADSMSRVLRVGEGVHDQKRAVLLRRQPRGRSPPARPGERQRRGIGCPLGTPRGSRGGRTEPARPSDVVDDHHELPFVGRASNRLRTAQNVSSTWARRRQPIACSTNLTRDSSPSRSSSIRRAGGPQICWTISARGR